MCLITDSNKMSIATEDITCYKIMHLDADGNFISPYTHFNYKKNKEYTITKYTTFYHRTPKISVSDEGIYFTSDFEIHENAFHSFQNLDDAMTEYRWLQSHCLLIINIFPLCVVKCIIPQNTEYVDGVFNSSVSFASKSIKITDEICAY